MDALITNLDTDPTFIPGPNLELAATGDPSGFDAKTWAGITLDDIDGNTVIKDGVDAGTLSVTLTPSASDDVQIDGSGRVGLTDPTVLPSYTVAELATLTAVNGKIAYASNGRAGAEGAGTGTGTPVVYTNGQWRRLEDLAQVAA